MNKHIGHFVRPSGKSSDFTTGPAGFGKSKLGRFGSLFLEDISREPTKSISINHLRSEIMAQAYLICDVFPLQILSLGVPCLFAGEYSLGNQFPISWERIKLFAEVQEVGKGPFQEDGSLSKCSLLERRFWTPSVEPFLKAAYLPLLAALLLLRHAAGAAGLARLSPERFALPF